MERKIVCYDLHGANSEDYNDLYEMLENKYNGIRITESDFVIFSNEKNIVIRDYIVNFCGSRKISFVVANLPNGVCVHMIGNSDKWLNK